MANATVNISETPSNASEFHFSMLQHPRSTLIGLVIMAVVIFIENVTVCALFAANKKLHTTTNIFVVSLATSDLFVAILFVPVYFATPIGHESNLYVVTFLLFTSLFNLCGVTYDRYHAILQPLTYRSVFTPCKIARLLFAIWFMPVLLIALPVIWSKQERNTRKIVDRCYLGFLVAVVFATFVVICKVYFHIFEAIRRQLRMTRHVKGIFAPCEFSSIGSSEKSSCVTTISSVYHAESPMASLTHIPREEVELVRQNEQTTPTLLEISPAPQQNFKLLQKIRFKNYSEKLFSDVRAVKLFALIILIFVICWLPVLVTNFMIAIDVTALIPHFIFDLSMFAFVANAIVNPLLFTFYKGDYRNVLLQTLGCKGKTIRLGYR